VHEQAWNALAPPCRPGPAVTTTLERDDIGTSPLIGALIRHAGLIDPPGEAVTNYAILAGMADGSLSPSANNRGSRHGRLAAPHLGGIDGEGTRDRRRPASLRGALGEAVIEAAPPEEPRVMLDSFRADPTPIGCHAEWHVSSCWSEQLAAFDLEDLPPACGLVRAGGMAGVSVAEALPAAPGLHNRRTVCTANWITGRASRARKVADPRAGQDATHDAAERGIRSGDVVRLFNDRGATLAGAVVTTRSCRASSCWPRAWYDPLEPGVAGSLDVHGNPMCSPAIGRHRPWSQGPAPGHAWCRWSGGR